MTYPHGGWPAPPPGFVLRHPEDPQEHASSKAAAVLTLGIVAVLLMFCGGGLVPAAAVLALRRPALAEIRESGGFLTGDRSIRAGVVMSWIALAVSAVVIVAVLVGLLITTVSTGPQFGENVD